MASLASPIDAPTDLQVIDTKESMELKVRLAELETQFEVLLSGLERNDAGMCLAQVWHAELTANPVRVVISFLVNCLCFSVKTAIFIGL